MKFIANSFRKLSFLSAAAYIFLFALAAKGVFIYASQHPSKPVFDSGRLTKMSIDNNIGDINRYAKLV
jgi:hypothetical protein